MDALFKKVPCRESQIMQLLELFGENEEPLPCSLFLTGSMATGKTLCLETVLDYLNYKHVVIDCIENYTTKNMFEEILHELMEDQETKCDTLSDLINNLDQLAEVIECKPIVVIFDRAERLRNMEHSIMPAFLRLRELCHLNICTVFVTHLIYDNFYFKMGVREPIKLYFPNYTKEEHLKIIFLNHKAFVDYLKNHYEMDSEIEEELEKPELLANFLNAFLSVFYRPCRDLIELQHMAKVNFIEYCKPIIKKVIHASDLSKLWRHIAPILKTSLEHIYLRIQNPPAESPDEVDSVEADYNFEHNLKEELLSTKTFAQGFELPYYAKFLLIAAYLASYNPPKEDKRLFMKNHGKQKKRLQQVRAKAKINEKLNTQLGPKLFNLDRLLAIFYAILEEKIGLTSNLLAQIATLVELKLIAGNKEIDLDSSKYKCLVTYDFISAVAQTVGFNIKKYLYDFI